MTDQNTPLSPRHERFVLEYLKDGNATRAYIRAGYSPRGAQPSASRLLRQPHIEAAIAAGQRRVAQALECSVERLAREYAKIAFANIDDFVQVEEDGRLRVDLEKASQAQRAGIVELKVSNHSKPEQVVTLKLGKLQALAALTRHVGLFSEKPEPGLTPEDRARYQAEIAAHEANWRHALGKMRQLGHERDEAQIALAKAQARIVAAGLTVPPPPPPVQPLEDQWRPAAPPEPPAPPVAPRPAEAPPPMARQAPMPAVQTPPPPEVAGPGQGRIFWNTPHQPPRGPTWHDIMRQAGSRFPGQ